MDYQIEFTVIGNHVIFDFDPRIPCLLAYKIKEVVEDFYKE